MSESERRCRWSWSIPPKEYPDLSHIKDWSNRLRAGEEAIFYNCTVIKQRPAVRTYLRYQKINGRGVITKEVGQNVDINGNRHLDQIHDYWLALINTPKVETFSTNGRLRIEIDTNSFAQRRMSCEFGEELPNGAKQLLLPTRAELFAAGNDEIAELLKASAHMRVVYPKLRSRLSANNGQQVSEIAAS